MEESVDDTLFRKHSHADGQVQALRLTREEGG